MDIHPTASLARQVLATRPAAPGSTSTGIAGIVRALWRKFRAGSDTRAPDSFIDLSEYMQKDIGINDPLPSRCVAQEIVEHRQRILSRMSVPLLVAALIAPPVLDAAGTATVSLPNARAQGEMASVATGEEVDGTPVYRLPSIVVVAPSKVGRASELHSKQAARTQQVRAKAVARSPV